MCICNISFFFIIYISVCVITILFKKDIIYLLSLCIVFDDFSILKVPFTVMKFSDGQVWANTEDLDQTAPRGV